MAEDSKPKKIPAVARLKKSTVEEIPAPSPGGRAVLWDVEIKGFGVRVAPNGRRTYVLSYRMGGREAPKRVFTIGRHGSPWTTEQARRRAIELLGMVRQGIDPALERVRARDAVAEAAERRAARSFDKLADDWMKGHVRRSKLRSERDIEGVVERDLKPAFAGKSVDEITRTEVTAALDAIGDRSEAAANKCHKWLRAMFNWFIDKGVVKSSPLDRMSRPFAEDSRTRALSMLELVVMLTAAATLPTPFGAFYRALALLGQRLREVAGMPRGELDIEAGEWLIPPARTKNKREHVVPLPSQVVDLLAPLAKGRAGADPVFTTDGRVPIGGFSKMKEALDDAIEVVLDANPLVRETLGGAFAPWVIHDLRRTLGTGCQAMRVPMEVTEAILNHVSGKRGGLAGVYQTYDYFDEKADALARWADLVSAALLRWDAGDIAGIIDLDPVLSARRRRRAGRDGLEKGDQR